MPQIVWFVELCTTFLNNRVILNKPVNAVCSEVIDPEKIECSWRCAAVFLLKTNVSLQV